jgi:AcrR family transcriptional regulator
LAPRKYSMDKRGAAVEETRQRIVRATLELHAKKGIFDTSWKDIAELADVSLATVYNHFPSLHELLPACGALIMARIRPLSPGDAQRIFGNTPSLEERLRRLVTEIFDFYERGESYLEVGPKERQLDAVQEWEAGMRAVREGLVREALTPVASDEVAVRTVSALLDFSVFRSFQRHRVPREEAEDTLNQMVLCWIRETREDR